MKRRWKVGMALAVVGSAGFLVWAVYSSSVPPVAIVFCGYQTNEAGQSTRGITLTDRSISALFCLTNGSPRTITCSSDFGTTRLRLKEKTADGWGHETFHSIRLPRGSTGLNPTQTLPFATTVNDPSHPLRVSLDYTYTIAGNRFLNLLPAFLRPHSGEHSVSLTIQDR